jgi:hypothetical protein
MRKVSTIIGLVLFALAGSASAQNESATPALDSDAALPARNAKGAPVATPAAAPVPAQTTAASAGRYALRGLTLPGGTFQAMIPVVFNLSKDKVLKPVWVPLDLSYGVNDQLTVFLNHSTPNGAIMGGRGPCIGGQDRGCYKFYNSLNLGAQYSLVKIGGLEVSGIGALQARTLDQGMRLAVDVGVGLKYVAAPFSIKVTPQIGIGINKRDEPAGNKEFIEVPLQVAFQATPKLAIFLDSGINGQTSAFRITYLVPVGIGAVFAALPNLDVGAEFMLPHAMSGMKGDNTTDIRSFAVFASYRM